MDTYFLHILIGVINRILTTRVVEAKTRSLIDEKYLRDLIAFGKSMKSN